MLDERLGGDTPSGNTLEISAADCLSEERAGEYELGPAGGLAEDAAEYAGRGENTRRDLPAYNPSTGGFGAGGSHGDGPLDPRQPGETTQLTRRPGRFSRLKKVVGALGLLSLGSIAGPATCTQLSSAYTLSKGWATETFTDTPKNIVPEVEETFRSYERELANGMYAAEVQKLQDLLDRHKNPEYQAGEVKRALSRENIGTVLRTFAQYRSGDQKALDKYVSEIEGLFAGYQSLAARKQRAVNDLANLFQEFNGEEKDKLLKSIVGRQAPDEQYRLALAIITQADKGYKAMVDLSRYLTPQQTSQLNVMTAKVPAAVPVKATTDPKVQAASPSKAQTVPPATKPKATVPPRKDQVTSLDAMIKMNAAKAQAKQLAAEQQMRAAAERLKNDGGVEMEVN